MKTLTPSRPPAARPDSGRPLLTWRKSWWTWSPFVWCAANLSAPTLWCLGLMLYADARCDRPFFWWSLPLAVGLANAGAVAHLKARHAAGDCFTRRAAGRAYLGMAVPVNMLLALLLAWRSGILSDIAPPIAATPASATALVLVVALLFALASHALTSLVLPWLTLASAANLRSR